MDAAPNIALLAVASYFWVVSANPFIFKFDAMSPNFYDLGVLFGLVPHEPEIDAAFKVDTIPYEDLFNTKNANLPHFVENNQKANPTIDKREHVAFLWARVCKYLACLRSIKAAKAHSKVAIVLAERTQIVMGHLNCHLYIKM